MLGVALGAVPSALPIASLCYAERLIMKESYYVKESACQRKGKGFGQWSIIWQIAIVHTMRGSGGKWGLRAERVWTKEIAAQR